MPYESMARCVCLACFKRPLAVSVCLFVQGVFEKCLFLEGWYLVLPGLINLNLSSICRGYIGILPYKIWASLVNSFPGYSVLNQNLLFLWNIKKTNFEKSSFVLWAIIYGESRVKSNENELLVSHVSHLSHWFVLRSSYHFSLIIRSASRKVLKETDPPQNTDHYTKLEWQNKLKFYMAKSLYFLYKLSPSLVCSAQGGPSNSLLEINTFQKHLV